MSLKPLIKDQTIRIDDHLQDGRVPHRWDDDRDIHIDKTTNSGKDKVRIKIPLNSDREITVTNAKEKIDGIPRKIRKEITKALSNKKIREEFVRSVLEVVRDFGANIENKEHAKQIVDRISKHFGKSKMLIDKYIDQKKYIQIREDKYYNLFFYRLSNKDLTIGQIDKYYIWRFIHEFPCFIRHLSSQHI